jgi:hypothetical protein
MVRKTKSKTQRLGFSAQARSTKLGHTCQKSDFGKKINGPDEARSTEFCETAYLT